MKTLSRTFRFIVLGVIVTVVVVSCCTVPLIKDTISHIEVGNSYVDLGSTKNGTYVEWKSQHKFDEALKQVCDNHGTYCIHTDTDPTHPYQPSNPHSNCTYCGREKIRTVKVTKSKAADKIAVAEAVANDPNVMNRVRSPNPDDIIKVLNALESPP
jgi:hypothetical protein